MPIHLLLYNKDFAKILPYLFNETGVLNIGGTRQTIIILQKKNLKSKLYLLVKKRTSRLIVL